VNFIHLTRYRNMVTTFELHKCRQFLFYFMAFHALSLGPYVLIFYSFIDVTLWSLIMHQSCISGRYAPLQDKVPAPLSVLLSEYLSPINKTLVVWKRFGQQSNQSYKRRPRHSSGG
jgi:hypothetical protein